MAERQVAQEKDRGMTRFIMPGTEDLENRELIVVRSLAEARGDWIGFDYVVTIEDDHFDNGLRISSSAIQQIVFQFDDTDRIGGNGRAPTIDQVRKIIEIGRMARGKRLLVHCHQGQSRSAAAALAILCDRLGPGHEEEAVRQLVVARPSAVCNRLVLRHADVLLRRTGLISRAWDDYERGNDRAAGIRLLRDLAHDQKI